MTSYSVTVNSFLAAGGDNFREFANGTNKRDTGQIDLQAMVDYMEEFAADEPLAVDAAQHSVGATVTDETITLTSLSMTGASDPKDAEVEVFDGATSLGTFPVTSALTETAVRRVRHGHPAEHDPERRPAARAAHRRRDDRHRHHGARPGARRPRQR